jgi:hypothetical protein
VIKRIILFCLIWVVVFQLFLVGCGKPSTASLDFPSTKTTSKIVITYSATTLTEIGSGFLSSTPTAENVYLVLDMTVENQGYNTFSTNPFYFSVIIDNVKYKSSFLSYDLDNELKAVDVLDGGKVEGALAFEVPTTVTLSGFQAVYQAFSNFNVEWIKK